MKTFTEPDREQLDAARAQVFLAETQQALHTLNVWGLTLTMTVAPRDMYGNQERRVIAHKRLAGEDVVIGNPEGHYVHPRNDDPDAVAYYINIALRRAKKEAIENAAR